MTHEQLASELAYTLNAIETCDREPFYAARNRYVMQAQHIAAKMGYETGIIFDPAEPAWPVIFIELPTGQVSWHIPEHVREWDGHTTEQKYERTALFIACVRPDIARASPPR